MREVEHDLIHHNINVLDGCPKKIVPLLSKRPSFFPGSQMGSTLPLPHVGSDADLHSASYASIFKPSEVLLPPLDMLQNLPHHFPLT